MISFEIIHLKLLVNWQEKSQKRATRQAESLGRSAGGNTTKLHVLANTLANPIDFILTEGQASDVNQAIALLELVPHGAKAFMADKAYDAKNDSRDSF